MQSPVRKRGRKERTVLLDDRVQSYLWCACEHICWCVTFCKSLAGSCNLFFQYYFATFTIKTRLGRTLNDWDLLVNIASVRQQKTFELRKWSFAATTDRSPFICPPHPPLPVWTLVNCWPLLQRDDWTVASHRCEISSAETELEQQKGKNVKSCPQEWLWLFLSNTENICNKSDSEGYYLSCMNRKAEDPGSFFL